VIDPIKFKIKNQYDWVLQIDTGIFDWKIPVSRKLKFCLGVLEAFFKVEVHYSLTLICGERLVVTTRLVLL
jgi:hypothetical protein